MGVEERMDAKPLDFCTSFLTGNESLYLSTVQSSFSLVICVRYFSFMAVYGKKQNEKCLWLSGYCKCRQNFGKKNPFFWMMNHLPRFDLHTLM